MKDIEWKAEETIQKQKVKQRGDCSITRFSMFYQIYMV